MDDELDIWEPQTHWRDGRWVKLWPLIMALRLLQEAYDRSISPPRDPWRSWREDPWLRADPWGGILPAPRCYSDLDLKTRNL